MKEIPLNHGRVAIVDDDMYEELSKFKWHYHDEYAKRCVYLGVRPNGNPLNRSEFMHHYVLPPKTGFQVDHKDPKAKLDNRRCNLRYATKQQQMANRPPFKGRKYKGVYREKGITVPWCAQIRVNSKILYLGCFRTEIGRAHV